MPSKKIHTRYWLSRLGTIAGFASLLASLMPAALAGYVPPADADAPTSRSTSGGRRGGCQGIGNIDLLALAPQRHVGQTASSHPTLTWFVPEDVRQPLEVELYKKTEGNQWQRLSSFTLEEGPTGLMSFHWPENEPGLEVGQTYRWQVISTCVVGLPSRDLVTTAEIEVVASATLSTLGADADPLQTAQGYAEASLWYDALAIASSSPTTPDLTAFRNQMLLELAALEVISTGNETDYLATQLRRIVTEE